MSCSSLEVRALLPDLAVDRRGDGQVGRVELGLDPRAERAERVEALGPGPLPVLLLQVARGDVVGAGVAEDDLVGPLRGHLPAEPADDDGQLALVVDPLGQRRRVGDGLPGTDHRGRRLEEDQRLVGHLAAHLAGVLGVVSADRDHLAGQHRRDQPDLGQRVTLAGELDRAERVPRDPGDELLAWTALDHAESDTVTCGEPGYTHTTRLVAVGVLPDRHPEPSRRLEGASARGSARSKRSRNMEDQKSQLTKSSQIYPNQPINPHYPINKAYVLIVVDVEGITPCSGIGRPDGFPRGKEKT